MIDKQAARAFAQAFLTNSIQPRVNTEVVLTKVLEYEHCWVVGWNSRKYVQSRQIDDALAGGGPIIVNRRTGAVRQGVCWRPAEEQVDRG